MISLWIASPAIYIDVVDDEFRSCNDKHLIILIARAELGLLPEVLNWRLR
jgi:hypothetical protein